MRYETDLDLKDNDATNLNTIYRAAIPLTLINTFVYLVAGAINNRRHHGGWQDAFLCSMRKIRPLIPTEQLCHEDQQRIIKALKNQDRHTPLPPDFQDFFRSVTNATCGTMFGQKCPVGEQLVSIVSAWDNGLANMKDAYFYFNIFWALCAFIFLDERRSEYISYAPNDVERGKRIIYQGFVIMRRKTSILWLPALTSMMYGVMFLMNIFHDQSYNPNVLEGLAQAVNQACPENNATSQCCHVSQSMSATTNKDLPNAMENDKVFRHWATAPFFLWTSALLVDLAFRCGRKYGRRFFASNADAGPNDATNDDDVELLDLVDLANDDDAGPNDATNDDDAKEQDNPHRFFRAPNAPSACRTNAHSEHMAGPSNT